MAESSDKKVKQKFPNIKNGGALKSLDHKQSVDYEKINKVGIGNQFLMHSLEIKTPMS